jgi:integrase
MATLFVDKRTGRYGIRFQSASLAADGRRKQAVTMLGTADKKLARALFAEWRAAYEEDEARRRLNLWSRQGVTLTELWARYSGDFDQRGLKPSTVAVYKSSVTRLVEYLRLRHGDDLIDHLSREELKGFLAGRYEEAMKTTQGKTGAAANTDLRHVRGILNWGGGEGLCPHGICDGIKGTAPKETEPDVLTDEELKKLFEAGDQIDREHGAASRRMGALLRMAYYHALRPEEVRSIQTYWIDEQAGLLTIRHDPAVGFVPKGKRERTIRIYPTVLAEVQAMGGYDGGTWLFGYGPTAARQGQGEQAWRRDWDRVRKLAKLGNKRAGGKAPLVFKQLRKNGALQYMLHTGSEAITRAVMGHSSDTQTLLDHYVDIGGYLTRKPSALWDREWIASLKAA